ncbi:antitoxin MazE family protein [Geomesophilobacter sediminis]|uniref:Antitoxin MazE family protein n=1 Tax=Geomesophilobacter sediminis TaxID=2798584 RepID=A0A8J7M2M8_9BACT|nr:antitoxin MazE family protein [Geomesophilobacter sediminis]MBJ6727517.1 antitoxin MazE family protein [Geomesophilobacter sediminis]
MQANKQRVHNYRQKLRAAGFKQVQIWVPDPKAPGFAEECQRQSLLAQRDVNNLEDLEAFAAAADWGDEP